MIYFTASSTMSGLESIEKVTKRSPTYPVSFYLVDEGEEPDRPRGQVGF